MGTRAHWFTSSTYFAVAVDEDGHIGRTIYGDTIGDVLDGAFADDPEAVKARVFRNYTRHDRKPELHGTYVRDEAGRPRKVRT